MSREVHVRPTKVADGLSRPQSGPSLSEVLAALREDDSDPDDDFILESGKSSGNVDPVVQPHDATRVAVPVAARETRHDNAPSMSPAQDYTPAAKKKRSQRRRTGVSTGRERRQRRCTGMSTSGLAPKKMCPIRAAKLARRTGQAEDIRWVCRCSRCCSDGYLVDFPKGYGIKSTSLRHMG